VLGGELLLLGAGLSGLHASKLASAANAREYEDVLGFMACNQDRQSWIDQLRAVSFLARSLRQSIHRGRHEHFLARATVAVTDMHMRAGAKPMVCSRF
jgi:hypothetical protein